MRKLTPPLPSAYTGDPVGKPLPQDSAARHVSGSAVYVDDMPPFDNELHVATGLSEHAHARINEIDLAAVRAAPGVVDVIVQADIPGSADISPVFDGDVMLAGEITHYVGQPLFAVAATSFEAAQRAARLARVSVEPLPALLDVDQALAREDFVLPPRYTRLGDAAAALAACEEQLEGRLFVGGQEHFYLEGQVCAVTPEEHGGVQVYCSSQHPSEVQKLVAEVLALPLHAVQVQVRRMGGGFGGKESQAAALACTAAVFCHRTGRPVRYRMARQHDMVQTGKRHPFSNRYRVGFDRDGSLRAIEATIVGDCGCTADLSDGIVDRAMHHIDNAYAFPAASISGYR